MPSPSKRPSFNVAVVGILLDRENNVLLEKRLPDDRFRPGEWVFPGGGLEPKDDCCEAAMTREVVEELGLGYPVSSWHIVGTELLRKEGEKPLVAVVLAASISDMQKAIIHDAEPEMRDGLRWTPADEAAEHLTPVRARFLMRALVALKA